MSHPYLLLWLEAPLQAWGHDSKFGRRDSLKFPTKSGVLGLLCAARGAGGAEREWLAAWADLDMQVAAYVLQNRQGQPQLFQPLLCDFHMVGSGYDEQDLWQTLHIPKTDVGKKAVGGGAKMTYRYYVQDMAYAIALQAPAQWADQTVAALQAPAWDLYLGRKNCVPTEWIFQGLYPHVAEAMQAGYALAQSKSRSLAWRVVQGEHPDACEVITLNDVPVQFGLYKQYRDRCVSLLGQE